MRLGSCLSSWLNANKWGLAIAGGGLGLRLVRMSPVWPASDAVDLPREIDGLVCGSGGVLDDLKTLALHRLGAIEPILSYLQMSVFRRLHVHVMELHWELVTLFVGSAVVFLAFLLGRQLTDLRGGILSGLLLATCPMAIIQSRHSGAPWMYEQFFQFLLLWLVVRLHERPEVATRIAFHGALGAYFWCGNQMMGIAPVVAYGAIAGAITRPEPEAVHTYLWRRYGGVSALIPAVSLSILLYVTFALKEGHLAHALFEKRHERGFYLEHWLSDMGRDIGPVVTWLGLGALLVGAVSERPLFSLRRLPSISFVSYAAPFWFMIPPGSTLTRGYITYGVSALLLVLGTVPFRGNNAAPLRLAFPLIAVGALALSAGQSADRLYHLDFLDARSFQGSYAPNNGVKTAAFWIRGHAEVPGRVFSDASGGVGIEPALMSMYFRQPHYSITDAGRREPFQKYRKYADRIGFLLISPANRPLVSRYFGDTFSEALRVTDGRDGEVLLVFARGAWSPPKTIDVAEGDKSFERRYSLLCE